MSVAILGAGAFGTALAVALSANGPVTLWARDIGWGRDNPRLPGVTLPDAIRVTDDMPAATQAALTASADPSQGMPTDGEIVPITSVLESGFSILPTVVPTGTMSMSAAEPAPTAGTPGGCNATAPAEAGKGKAGLGWMKDSGECASDFLQPGNKVSW